MRTIVISDIKTEGKSIIPYALHLAKNLESELYILHVIDSRSLQGVQSTYSDSQTVTPGNKLSHNEIIDRERKHAEMALDVILSGEASRLNYPLKYNTIIDTGNISTKVNELIDANDKNLMLVNSTPDNFIFHSIDEILDTIKQVKIPTMTIPEGYSFEEIRQTCLITRATQNGLLELISKISFLERFNSVITLLNDSKPKSYQKNRLKGKMFENRMFELTPFNFEMKTLAGDLFNGALIKYIQSNKPQLVIAKINKQGFFNKIFQKNRSEKLIRDLEIPILFY